MLSSQDINALGNILDITFGRSGHDGFSISHTLQGNRLTLKYNTIVHFASERSMRDQVALLVDESNVRLKDKVTGLKKEFKEATGNSLKVKEISNKDDVELIQATTLSPRKIAYYRRFADLEIDV